MSDSEQDEPVMAGSDDAGNDEKLSGLIEQVEHDHGDEGAGAMADALRDRADETDTDIASDADPDDSGTAQV